MAKSVDKIVKGLEKLINQLDVCASNCSAKMSLQTDIINHAQLEHGVASIERDRAARIRNKLLELIK